MKFAIGFYLLCLNLFTIPMAQASEEPQVVCVEEETMECITVAAGAGVGIGALKSITGDVREIARTEAQIREIERRSNAQIFSSEGERNSRPLTQAQVSEISGKVSQGGQVKITYYLNDQENRQIYARGFQKRIEEQLAIAAEHDKKATQALLKASAVEDPAYSQERAKADLAKKRALDLSNQQKDVLSGKKSVKPIRFVKVFNNSDPKDVEKFLLRKSAKDVRFSKVVHLPAAQVARVSSAAARVKNLKIKGRVGVAAFVVAGAIAVNEISEMASEDRISSSQTEIFSRTESANRGAY